MFVENLASKRIFNLLLADFLTYILTDSPLSTPKTCEVTQMGTPRHICAIVIIDILSNTVVHAAGSDHLIGYLHGLPPSSAKGPYMYGFFRVYSIIQ
jgi:hypothetical protein